MDRLVQITSAGSSLGLLVAPRTSLSQAIHWATKLTSDSEYVVILCAGEAEGPIGAAGGLISFNKYDTAHIRPASYSSSIGAASMSPIGDMRSRTRLAQTWRLMHGIPDMVGKKSSALWPVWSSYSFGLGLPLARCISEVDPHRSHASYIKTRVFSIPSADPLCL